MDESGLFHKYWQEWESKLEALVRRRGARLSFPALLGPSRNDEGKVTFTPEEPLFIYNVPQKASSGKARRNAILVQGSFTFFETGGGLLMIEPRASISIYDIRPDAGGKLTAKLFDSLHFDVEPAQKQKAFHPMFHIQRGADSNLTDDVVIRLLARQSKVPVEEIEILKGEVSGSPYLRLPSPQLDYFSVLVMVIADFFCNPDDPNPNVLVMFKSLLALLCDDRNIARQCESSGILFSRSQSRGWASSAHWYAESST